MFTKRGVVALVALLTAASPLAAQSDSLLREWRMLTIQSELVRANAPYLALDAQRQSFEIRLGSGVVWELVEDSATTKLDTRALVAAFADDSLPIYGLASLRLLKYEPRFPDSLLAIVSNAMDMDPSLLQREIPVMFEIKWRGGPTLLVHSLPENQPVELQLPWREKLGLWIARFNGPKAFDVQINRELALTLYRVLRDGAVTLVLR